MIRAFAVGGLAAVSIAAGAGCTTSHEQAPVSPRPTPSTARFLPALISCEFDTQSLATSAPTEGNYGFHLNVFSPAKAALKATIRFGDKTNEKPTVLTLATYNSATPNSSPNGATEYANVGYGYRQHPYGADYHVEAEVDVPKPLQTEGYPISVGCSTTVHVAAGPDSYPTTSNGRTVLPHPGIVPQTPEPSRTTSH